MAEQESRSAPERFAILGLFILGLLGAFYLMRAIILPLVLAILLSYLFAPVIRALQRVHIPASITSALIVLAGILVMSTIVSFLVAPAFRLLEKAPEGLHRLQQEMTPLKKAIEKISKAAGEVEKGVSSPQQGATMVAIDRNELSKQFFGGTSDLVARITMMLILLYFLLAYSGLFLEKLVKVIPRFSDKKKAVLVANQIEQQISRYLLTITLINFCLGLAVGTAVYFIGLPNPLLWVMIVFGLNFVPYLGAVTGITSMALIALLSFDSVAWALACPAAYLAIATLEGNFITPSLLGRSLTLNPVVILISLMFWGWLWGIAGMILAVPILAVFKIICDNQPDSLGAIGEFLRR